MREKINVLYYPDMQVSDTTLKKCILFFDEIHFMDRPAITIDNFGLIGAPSPFRRVEQSFRNDAGVPLYVHGVSGGRAGSDLLEKIYSDISDELYIENFIEGLDSHIFRSHQFPEGDYGSFGGNQAELINLLKTVDLSIIQSPEEAKMAMHKSPPVFDRSRPETAIAFLLRTISLCSAKINFALTEGVKQGFTPLADAEPYAKLLGAQYKRVADKFSK